MVPLPHSLNSPIWTPVYDLILPYPSFKSLSRWVPSIPHVLLIRSFPLLLHPWSILQLPVMVFVIVAVFLNPRACLIDIIGWLIFVFVCLFGPTLTFCQIFLCGPPQASTVSFVCTFPETVDGVLADLCGLGRRPTMTTTSVTPGALAGLNPSTTPGTADAASKIGWYQS